MTITLYGIPNCDTVKKARTWLGDNGVAFDFHDYKKSGVPREALEGWVESHGWNLVLNKAGTTFKKLPDEAKADLDAAKAMALMMAQPSMIKRPILARADGETVVGFKPEAYEAFFR